MLTEAQATSHSRLAVLPIGSNSRQWFLQYERLQLDTILSQFHQPHNPAL
jgi:hypothetical protein